MVFGRRSSPLVMPSLPTPSIMEDVNQQAFSVKDLSTRSVTVYPASAAVVRDVPNISIKPGRNEYTIVDISSYADESTFKIEGHGTNAAITDMTVELIVGPAALSQQRGLDSDSESESDESDLEPPESDPAIKALDRKLQDLQWQTEAVNWNAQSLSNEISAWELFGRNLCEGVAGMSEYIGLVDRMDEFTSRYHEARFKAAEKQLEWSRELAALDDQRRDLRRERAKTLKPLYKAHRKAMRTRERRAVETKEKMQEKVFQRQMGSFQSGAKSYYRVKVTVEQDSLPPDAGTIGSSVDTGKPRKEEDEEAPLSEGPSLRISYIVRNVSWTPRYEIRLDTVHMTASLTYRAEMTNLSGELWKNALVTLSTSQSRFSGLGQKVPGLDAWRLGLNKDAEMTDNNGLFSDSERPKRPVASGGLFGYTSLAQAAPPDGSVTQSFQNYKANNTGLFGQPPPLDNQKLPEQAASGGLFGKPAPFAEKPASGGVFGKPAPFAEKPASGGLFGKPAPFAEKPASGGLFGNPAPLAGKAAVASGSGLFGSKAGPAPPLFGNTIPTTSNIPQAPVGTEKASNTSSALFGSRAASSGSGFSSGGLFGSSSANTGGGSLFGSSSAIRATSNTNTTAGGSSSQGEDLKAIPGARMETATTHEENYGITTTFTLPGMRTIPSSATTRRYTITEAALEDVEFSYSSVPVIKPVVYVAASGRLPDSAPAISHSKNKSPFGGLVGPSAGITVDGAYLGMLSISRTAPGEKLTMDLGVEEGITITYKHPTKKTSTQGLVKREAIHVLKRGFELVNKRPKPVTVLVRDHVPVAKEGVAVRVLKPKGLEKEDDRIQLKKEDGSAKMLADGVVEWSLTVAEQGGTKKGTLEWEVRVPAGEAWGEVKQT